MSVNTLGGYKIIREIARSNDIVYEAVDGGINRRVALKELLLPPNATGVQKRERVERFYREARAAGALSHPNIVTIFEAGEDRGRHFIAMEFLEGQTLRDLLEVEGKLSVERAVEIALQVCDALTYAHSKGVIHRDIKPDNIQIIPSGGIKITDFGIARIMEEPTLTADGQVFGTPSYMSPEQVAGKDVDPRTDIFSLGVLLFEMLAGKKPFTGDTVVTITYNIMNQEVVVPPIVPAYLERVLRRCLAKDAALRYSSAAEVKADLDPSTYQNGPSRFPPDPFVSTTSMPGPAQSPPAPTQLPPSQSLPDPFAGMRSGDLNLPRSSKPLLSPDSRYFLNVMLAVIAVCVFAVGLVWVLVAGYQGWSRHGHEIEVARHMEAGERHFRSQSYLAAIEEFREAERLSRDPEVTSVAKRNIAVSYTKLGLRAEQAGNSAQAATYFNQSIVSDDTFAEGYLFFGNSLKKMHRNDDALAAWKKALEVGVGSEVASAARQNIAVVYHERGDEAYRLGDSDAAIRWWRNALEIAPGTQAGFMAQEKLDTMMGGGFR